MNGKPCRSFRANVQTSTKNVRRGQILANVTIHRSTCTRIVVRLVVLAAIYVKAVLDQINVQKVIIWNETAPGIVGIVKWLQRNWWKNVTLKVIHALISGTLFQLAAVLVRINMSNAKRGQRLVNAIIILPTCTTPVAYRAILAKIKVKDVHDHQTNAQEMHTWKRIAQRIVAFANFRQWRKKGDVMTNSQMVANLCSLALL